MKKHSPNTFRRHEKMMAILIERCDFKQHKKSRTNAVLFFVIVATFFFFLTSCTKAVDEPVDLQPPTGRPKVAVEISIRFYPATHPLVKGNVYGVEIKASQILKTHTEISIAWKDSIFNYTLIPHIRSGESQIRWETMLPIYKGASDVRFNRVNGDTTLSYILKVIP